MFWCTDVSLVGCTKDEFFSCMDIIALVMDSFLDRIKIGNIMEKGFDIF